MKAILEERKQNLMYSLQGHSECVTINRWKMGNFMTSYGTFGLDINGNRIGEKKIL